MTQFQTIVFDGGVLDGHKVIVECAPGRPYSHPYRDIQGKEVFDTYLPVSDPAESHLDIGDERLPHYYYLRTTPASSR